MTEESGRVNWQANVVVRADREAVVVNLDIVLPEAVEEGRLIDPNQLEQPM